MSSFLTQYKELLVNGLDLLSFILVTPEIVLRLRPALGEYVSIIVLMIGVLCGAAALFYPFYLLNTYRSDNPWDLLWLLPAIVMFLLLGTFVYGVILSIVTEGGAEIAAWLGAHTLVVGICTFFLSRLIAFGVAAHDLFG